MEGVLLINKPSGITSHDVVDRVREITGMRRVGHAGTLDPLAEGLLVVLVGRSATKQQAIFMAGEKEYEAGIRLGATSDTDDAEGVIEQTGSALTPTREEVEKALLAFGGEIEQIPPAYSAIKLKGKKAYELAREGKQPELKPRRITILELQLLAYTYPDLRLRIICSKGTYIRSLARDIGKLLGCGAYLTSLLRTRSGSFSLDDAIALDDLRKDALAELLLQA